MDGYIQIGTKVDSSGIDKGVAEIQKKIDVAEKQKIEIEAKIRANKSGLQELEAEYNRLIDKAEQLRNMVKAYDEQKAAGKSFKASDAIRFEQSRKELEALIPQIDKIATEMNKVKGSIAKQEIAYQKLNNQVDSYRGKIENIQLKNQEQQSKQMASQLGKASSFAAQFGSVLSKTNSLSGALTRHFSGIGKSISSVTKSVQKWGLALIGIRSAYAGIRRLMSTIQSYNAQISADMKYLGFTIANAFQPIVSAIVSALYRILSLINQIVFVISGFNLFKNSGVSKFQKAMAKSAGSSEQIKNNLAKFDDLDVLNDDKGGGGGGSAMPSMDLSKDKFLDDFLGDAYDLGYALGEKLNQALESIDWDAIQAKVEQMSYNLAQFFNGLVDAINWDLIGYTLAQGLNTVLIAAYTFIKTFHWGTLGTALATAINSFFKNTKWDLLGKTLGGYIQAMIEMAFNFVETLDWVSIGASFGVALNNFFASINWLELARTVGDAIIGIFNGISAFLAEVDWAKIGEDIKTFISNINWEGIWEAVKQVIVEACSGIDELLSAIFGEDNAAIIEGLAIAIGAVVIALNGMSIAMALVAAVSSPVTLIILAIGVAIATLVTVVIIIIKHWEEFGVVIKTVTDAIKKKITDVFNSIKTFLTNTFENIKTTITNALNSIKEFWSNIFTGIYNTTTEIFNNIWSTIKGVINSIISGIETMANSVVNGVNTVVDSLNSLSFTIPDWVPGFGGKSWSMNIPRMSTVSLPRLAQGGIISQPTTALIGEAGKEAVLPLENNTEWLDLLSERISQAIGSIQVEAKGNGEWGQFMRFLNIELVKEQARKGTNYIGGTY